ncbi:MAG: aminotransferase class I/II-fold pyridoxal phosphate-dependent enzyme, partial [Candidatus Omnitrophota bacterium]
VKSNQKYALDQGKQQLRHAIRGWLKKRFGLAMNEDREILPLIGSKEGLVHLPLAFADSGDYVIVPSPGYPGYRSGAVLSGAKVYELPLLERNKFLPDLLTIPLSVRNKAK